MLSLLKKLIGSPLSLLPDLTEYDVQRRPKRGVVINKKTAAEGNIFAGKAWNTEWNDTGFDSNKQGSTVPDSPTLVTLDEYDQAFLSDVVGEAWVRDMNRAKIMKWHWLNEFSAQRIEQYHTADGKLEKGYSERTAGPYIKAFYEADNEREKDGKQRQRIAPATAPNNVVSW